MKRAGFVFFALFIIFCWTGCASSGKAVLLAQREPIALVALASNENIPWKGQMPANPDRTNFFSRRALQESEELTLVSSASDLINTAESLIRDAVTASGIISLADRNTVLSSGAYREALTNRLQERMKMISPEGFRLIDYRDKNFPAALAAETGIQRSMFVEFNLSKAMVSGIGQNGKCQAELEMNVFILDAQGKKLYSKTYSMVSWSLVKVSSGAYSGTEMMNSFEDAIIDVCGEFINDLKK